MRDAPAVIAAFLFMGMILCGALAYYRVALMFGLFGVGMLALDLLITDTIEESKEP